MQFRRNWYVLTGPPGAGKTTILQALRASGIATVGEAARTVLELSARAGIGAAEVRKDERRFQDLVLGLKVAAERRSDPERITVFDRGIPDTLAYYRLNGWPSSRSLEEALAGSHYGGAFLCERLPTVPADPVRTESEAQRGELGVLLANAYEERDIRLHVVAMLPVASRVEMVLGVLGESSPQ